MDFKNEDNEYKDGITSGIDLYRTRILKKYFNLISLYTIQIQL